MPINPQDVTPAEFFRALWGDTAGWAELTTISKDGVRAHPFKVPDSIDSIYPAALNHNKTANVYMGVCLRKEKWPRPSGRTDTKGKQILEQRGTEANAQSSWCVWCEFDFEGQGHKGNTTPVDAARKKLKEFKYPPSIIVKSGGGIHVYWLLREPAEGEDLWRVKAINKALAAYFEADAQSVDLARILRIPGTKNVKYSPPRPVELSWWEPDKRYILDDFEDLLPVQKVYLLKDRQEPSSENNKAIANPSTHLEEDSIAELSSCLSGIFIPGHRHECSLHVAGMLAFAGITEDSTKRVIQIASEATQGDTYSLLKNVETTYENLLSGKLVTGRTSFEKMFKADPYPKKQEAAHFLEVFTKITSPSKKKKKEPVPPPQLIREEAPSVDGLPLSDYVKRIIKEGHDGYVDFLKSTETPAKFRELQVAGKMTRTVADSYIVTTLLQAQISEQVIHAIFNDPKYKIGEKAREKEEDIDDYISCVIKECQHAIKSQPKWQPASLARGAAKKIDVAFEDEHFKIISVLKYVQDNPTYNVIVMVEGLEYFLEKCSLDQVYTWDLFAKTFFKKFDFHLPEQKPATWTRMYAAAERSSIKVEKEEGTFEGQMDVIINLLEETAVDSKSADISINHSAVRTKEGEIVFKTPIILRMLKDRWIEAKKQDVTHYLKHHNWNYTSKRLGRRVDWVWCRATKNDQVRADGTPATPETPTHPSNGATYPPQGNGTLFEVTVQTEGSGD